MTSGEPIRLTTPLKEDDLARLRIGDRVLINGYIFTARDAAHKRLVELINQKKELPIDLKGQIIYYVGPTPPRPGQAIGSAGPTTSSRMDAYAPLLMEQGLKAMIGKGFRAQHVVDAIRKHKAVYFAAVGGAGALLSKKVVEARVVAYEDLGPEAIYRLKVVDFPVIVINDVNGGDLYKEGVKRYSKE